MLLQRPIYDISLVWLFLADGTLEITNSHVPISSCIQQSIWGTFGYQSTINLGTLVQSAYKWQGDDCISYYVLSFPERCRR